MVTLGKRVIVENFPGLSLKYYRNLIFIKKKQKRR